MIRNRRKKMNEARILYGDIIDLPHHQSQVHPHMSLYDRAAQFAPFAALTGYDDMITEEARETGLKLAQNLKRLNAKIKVISDMLDAGEHPMLSFTVFVPDEKKAGGSYTEMKGIVKRIDPISASLILFSENEKSDGLSLKLEDIHDIYGEAVDYLDDEIL